MYQYFNNINAQQIVRVSGENGARAYQMAPNSSALLLDETAPIVWLAKTDGAGYKDITPYKIEPFQPEPEPDLKNILERLEKLEGTINNVKPDIAEPANKK